MGSLEHPFVRHLMERASAMRGRIAIPDARFDARFLEAALLARRQGWFDPILVGSRDAIRSLAAGEGWQLGDVRILDPDEAVQFAKVWLSTPFDGGRHAPRVAKLEALDRTACENRRSP